MSKSSQPPGRGRSASEHSLPEFVLGVPVRRGRVDEEVPGGKRLAAHLVASDREVLFMEGSRRLLVRDCDEIVVDAPPGDEATIAHHLYGIAARCVLLHRGSFSLHASLVSVGGTCVAVAGDSGAGKSTTAAALEQRGGQLLIDDVLPVVVCDGDLLAEPFDRPVHLAPQAARSLGISTVGAPTVLGSGKAVLDLARPQGSVRLRRLVRLEVGPPGAPGGLRLLPRRGADRLREVVRLSNPTGLASLGRRSGPYFEWCAALADILTMATLIRPEGSDTVSEVADLIERVLRHRTDTSSSRPPSTATLRPHDDSDR